MKRFHLILLLVAILASCSGDNDLDCAKSTGKWIEKDIMLKPFSAIIIDDDFEVFLTQGTEYKAKIIYGENLLSEIKTIVTGDSVEFNNNVSCKWVRKYKAPQLYITFPYLDKIHHKGYNSLISTDTLVLDYFYLSTIKGIGDVNLKLNTRSLHLESNSQSNIILAGKTDYMFVGFYFNDGKLMSENLISNDVLVNHHGSNLIKVHALNSLTINLYSSGDVCFNKSLKERIFQIEGKGRIFQCD